MKNKVLLRHSPIIIFLFITSLNFAQTDITFEFQAYPTGLIPGLRIEKNFKEKYAAHLRIGYNWVRHRDLGEHKDERGDGYGFTLGYKRFFKEDYQGFFLGARNDFWWNEISWEDTDEQGTPTSGQTKITVVQPTLEAGFALLKGNFLFTPTAAFGFEFNVKTEGEATGEGPILLLGFNLGLRI